MNINKLKKLITFLFMVSIIMFANFVLATDQEENTNVIPTVSYRTHVQDVGWQDYVQNGEISGTSGQAKRLEGINIKLLNNNDLNIKYQVHIQDIGWQEWKINDEIAGTSGQSKRLEAIRIKLENTSSYSIIYRVHVQDVGWQEWKKDGELAGTEGQGKRLEAIEIKLIEKQKVGLMYIDTPVIDETYYNLEDKIVSVSGWKMSNARDAYIKAYIDNEEINKDVILYKERQDVISAIKGYGTEKENPLPGFQFDLDIKNLNIGEHTIKVKLFYNDEVLDELNVNFYIDNNIHIQYQAHIQNIGWQEWKKDGETLGTEGQALRVEAVKLKLFNIPEGVNIKYRAHIQDIGWQEWKKDGEISGTIGQSKRVEALQVKIEGLNEYVIEYKSHVQNIGWQQWASSGMISGTVNQCLRIEAMQFRIVKLDNTVVPSVKYSSHVGNIGWTEYVSQETISGQEGSSNIIEALKVKLENIDSNTKIKYQLHVSDIGWMNYVQNNEIGGTTGRSLGIEAIRIKLENLNGYSIEYRTYVNGKGWQDWVRDGKTSGTVGKNRQISAIQIRVNIDAYPHNKSNYENIDTGRYPGYRDLLDNLQSKHPEWSFKLLYTGISLDEAIRGECALHSRNLVPSSYSGEWVCSACGTRLYDSGWYCASEKAVSYYMDPRNFLDETNVFQFLDLNSYNSDSVSLGGIQTKVNGSFLHNYADAINNACRNTNVNPYYIIARLIQEQGYSGTRIGTGMDGGNGRTYYNPFNIGASGNGYDAIYANALATAKENGWDSMQKAIEGGIAFCKKNWLENYQNTLYQNKFDIDSTNGTSLYTHQYMQNLMGAYSEARTLRSMYANTGKLDSEFTFIIPVYEGLSSSLSAQPAYNSETTPINVRVTANGGLNLRNDADINSSTIRIVAQGEVVLSVQRGINSNWQKIILNDGTIGYMSGNYLQQVNDVTNCNYSAYVKTSDGSGCYIRVGPSTRLDRITALTDGTWLTVINEGTYNNIDGFNWVRVLLSDGRQAFMPSKYLSR